MRKQRIFVLVLFVFCASFLSLYGSRGEATPAAPRMDVVFLVDTTGSMGDEISVVQKSIVDMIAEIEGGKPVPDVRFGLVIYRDRGDDYITKKFELTRDTDSIIKAIRAMNATGGGDEPESVNEALHVAINEMNWDKDIDTEKTVFLIGDAPPNIYEDDYRWEDEIARALDRYIIINAIGCSGLSSGGVDVFTKIAKGTEGNFEFLTYQGEYVNADGSTDTVIVSGDEYYSMSDGADADLWKLGAKKAEKEGLMERSAEPSFAVGSGGDLATPRGAPSVVLTENNLDSLLTHSMKEKMISKGVTYGKEISYTVLYSGSVSTLKEDREFTIATKEELKKTLKELGVPEEKISPTTLKDSVIFGYAAGGERNMRSIDISGASIEGKSLTVTMTGAAGTEPASPVVFIAVSVPEETIADFYFVKE